MSYFLGFFCVLLSPAVLLAYALWRLAAGLIVPLFSVETERYEHRLKRSVP